MQFDTHANLASGTILTPPSPADSGTVFTLFPGDGPIFEPNMPVTICPPGTQPDADNAEIGYLTTKSGDVLTVLRHQEGSTARAVQAGWKVYGTLTAKTITDIEDAVQAKVQQTVTGMAEAFNQPIPLNGATVNPTVVIGIDQVSGIIFGADRPTNDISMSTDGGLTWQHDRGMPAGVNHVQLHKIVRYGAHIYLFAISPNDQRAGVYRASAPTAATDLIGWEIARTNRITNPSFEAGSAGWTTGGSVTISNPSGGGFSGDRVLRLTAITTGLFTANSNTFPVVAGQSYAFSAYVRGTTGIDANVRCTWTGSTATGGSPITINSTSSFQRITASGTVPAGATAARVDIRVAATNVIAGSYIEVDSVLAELDTAVIGNYFEGTEHRRYVLMKQSTSVAGPNFETMNGKSTVFAAGSSALLLGDYGDFAEGPSLQRSLNGTSWTTVWSSTTSRHVHAVAEDPYNPGTWYATIGDGSANTACILRSEDNGANWTTAVSGTGGNLFQSVQISFSARYVYLAADHYGASAFYLDRNSLVIHNLNFGSHVMTPVPGGIAGRIVLDLATTSGSTAVTSAAITSADRGRVVRSDNLPAFAAISNPAEMNWLVGASTGSATLRRAATATGTATAYIGGDAYFVGSYFGAVDPATDIFYFVAMDTSSIGNTFGLFCITHPGGVPVLLGTIATLGVPPSNWRPVDEVYVKSGIVYAGTVRFPAITI